MSSVYSYNSHASKGTSIASLKTDMYLNKVKNGGYSKSSQMKADVQNREALIKIEEEKQRER